MNLQEPQLCIPGFRCSLEEKVDRAIALLREYEPPEGYWIAFSGGKDSCVILELAKMASVKYDAHYNNTTIDPPALVKFIKQQHPSISWMMPKHGNMLERIATHPVKPPPTRQIRWCCEEYKENIGIGRFMMFGIRAAESSRRARLWKEVTEHNKSGKALCAIVGWSDDDVWRFIHANSLPYCSLYDEGFKRLGCVGCPLAGRANQEKEWARWPWYRKRWEWAVKTNWKRLHNKPRLKDGQPRFQARFKTAEDYWQWWLTTERPDYLREECQTGMLWTNE